MTNPYPQIKVKHLFNVVNGSTPQSSVEEYWDGDIPWVTPEDIGKLTSSDILSTRRRITESGYKSCGTTLAPVNSIVLTTRAPIGNIGLAKVSLCSNQGCKILIPRETLVPKYGFYAVFSQVSLLQSLGQGSTFKEISSDSLKQTPLPTPPLPTQKAIASFLDKETSRMDVLISKKERQIELLQEKRQAIITRAVTKGLDPNAKMKDSGVEWIGEIPCGWEVRRLKYIAAEITVGIVVNPSAYYVDDGMLCLRSLNISNGQLDLSSPVYISAESNEYHRKSMLFEGDIVLVRTGKAGTPFVIPKDLNGINCIDLLIIRRSDRVVSQFLYYVLLSDISLYQYQKESVGAIQAHFNTSTLTKMTVPLPSLPVQNEVVGYLDSQMVKLRSLERSARDSIALLQEHRSSLITAAVSGQIDVSKMMDKAPE